MAHVRWHATVCSSWFLVLFQDPNTSHANPYACPGSRICTCKSLPFYRFLTIQATPSSGKAPDISDNSLRRCRLPTLHTQIFMLVQVPNNLNNSSCRCRLSMLHTQILTPVQVPNNSDNSLCRGSLPTIQKIPYTTKINSMLS
ncbi:hypothetical protein O181_113121 [Austropuccinia psidii MF-1]|uniref:Secreted protein n=1 Tax=Austropuccinia psidii MF-1 TaxID=1389203 RepID=A0A9Q3K3P7_9BASI|nr:hypothetical protein [Austropuccinia psidii MF-1]